MRLTRYDDENRYYRPCDYESDKQSTILKLCKKLGQLEDIEEELGINLVVLLKAIILNEELFYKDSNGKINSTENEISLNMDGDGLCLHIRNIGYFFVKDYGKKWSLTKEELENE